MLNIQIICGNLGGDPEVKTFGNGDKVANFSVATSERWKNDKGEQQERTEWHKVAVYGNNLIDKVIVPYLKKGSKVVVVGKKQTDKKDNPNGTTSYFVKLIVRGPGSEIVLCDKAPSQGGGHNPTPNVGAWDTPQTAPTAPTFSGQASQPNDAPATTSGGANEKFQF